MTISLAAGVHNRGSNLESSGELPDEVLKLWKPKRLRCPTATATATATTSIRSQTSGIILQGLILEDPGGRFFSRNLKA